MLGTVGGCFARFGVEALEQIGGIVACVALNLLDQQLLGLVGREARDAFELVLLLRDQTSVLGLCRLDRLLVADNRLFAPLEVLFGSFDGRLALDGHGLAPNQGLLQRLRLLPFEAGLFLGRAQQFVGLFLRVEQSLLLPGF